MPIDVALNKAIRDRVRRDLVLPFADPRLVGGGREEDTSPETLSQFRAAGLVAPVAPDLQPPPAPQELIRPGVMLSVNTGVPVAGTNLQAGVVGPVPLSPAILESISVNLNVAAAADGGTHGNVWTAFISTNTDLTLSQLQADQCIIAAADFLLNGLRVAQSRVSGFTGMVDNYPTHTPIPVAPAYLKFANNVVGNIVFGGCVFHIRQAASAVTTGTAFVPIITRIQLNPNTQPTRTRGNTPPTPRGARISVTQGGRVLTQRVVSWPALTPAIRAQWFNQQLGAPGDPNIQWIP